MMAREAPIGDPTYVNVYGHPRTGLSDFDDDVYHRGDVYVDQRPVKSNISSQIDSKAPSKEPDDNKHLETSDLLGVQHITIYPSFCASLSEFANDPKLSVWSMTKDNLKYTKHNKRTINRTNANDADLVGDLSKAIFTGAELLWTTGDCPVQVGVKINIFEPRGYTDSDRYAFVIPANSNTMALKQSIFEPVSLFSKHSYENWNKCNHDALEKQILFEPGGENHALVDLTGFVWDVIMDNSSRWPGFEDTLRDIDANAKNTFELIPIEIATEVHASIKEKLDDILDSFVDMRTIEISINRTDNEKWDQCNGLVGEAVAFGKNSNHVLLSTNMERKCNVGCAIRLSYVQFS
jgi:hypothetical protein